MTRPFILIALVLLCIGTVQASEIPFNETIAGDRNLGQMYTWTVNNASGYADCVYHYAVYDYRVIGVNYTYHSPSWGQWFIQEARPGNVYIAVWVRGWTEGTTWYGYDQGRFPMWVWDNTTIQPEPVHLQDLENGKLHSGKFIPAIIRELENRTAITGKGLLTSERYGWKDNVEHIRMEPGRSNAMDGYLLYQIPVQARPEDLRVAGWFGFFGTPVWNFRNVTIDQASIEKQLIIESEKLKMERVGGMRLSDRQSERARG